METCRIHISGAAGAGTTTLGRALAGALGHVHFDTDVFLWTPSTPPDQVLRTPEDPVRLMAEMFLSAPHWVLSGSAMGFGIDSHLDIVVFLATSPETRQLRLRARETQRFGVEAVAPGGWRHEETEAFLEWATHYEDGTRQGRTLAKHLAWLKSLSCPKLSLDGGRPVEELVGQVMATL